MASLHHSLGSNHVAACFSSMTDSHIACILGMFFGNPEMSCILSIRKIGKVVQTPRDIQNIVLEVKILFKKCFEARKLLTF